MSTTYTYAPKPINGDQLLSEIAAAGLPVPMSVPSYDTAGNVLIVHFSALAAGDVTTQDGVVAAHNAGAAPTPPDPGSYVVGPASCNNTAVARFQGTTGKVVQNSPLTVSSAGTATLAADVPGTPCVVVLAAPATGGSGSYSQGSLRTYWQDPNVASRKAGGELWAYDAVGTGRVVLKWDS